MLVEFIGGSLDGKQKQIERFFEYMINDDEVYYVHAINYKQLGWVYVWYQLAGNYSSQGAMA